MIKLLASYIQISLCTLACSFASAHSHHTATEVIADHSNHKQSIPLPKIARGHIIGDNVFVVNTPGPKELPRRPYLLWGQIGQTIRLTDSD